MKGSFKNNAPFRIGTLTKLNIYVFNKEESNKVLRKVLVDNWFRTITEQITKKTDNAKKL